MHKLNLAIIWNMHQPYYKDLVSGEYILPWVRLHGIKDYFYMVNVLDNFPNVRQTFNLVPSLMKQIEDYASTDPTEINDTFLKLTLKPAASLTVDNRCFLLRNFFLAHWDNMIKIYPRYRKLLQKRGEIVSDDDLPVIQNNFTVQEMLDLQVWYNLTWFDPSFKETVSEIKRLIKQGRGFKEEDKLVVLKIQQDIMKKILPEYKRLQDKGLIEICLSPMYHPILPLLCDSHEARMATPDINLPKERFQFPEDAEHQVRAGIDYYKKVFKCAPKGMWPSEGSLSQEILPILSKAGVKWVASDEEILAHSLDIALERDEKFPDILYRPYRKNDINMVFRDHQLSDLIGFVYSGWSKPREAARDLLRRLHTIRNDLGNEASESLVTIVLDGENAWEYYKNDGHDFLESLYGLLDSDPLINSTTVSGFLEKKPPVRDLPKLFSGSWINHDFRIWIGHQEDNRAWDQIYRARAALKRFEKKNTDQKTAEKLSLAWEELYIAEGSDWFWWYGDDHSSQNDADFDNLFRKHLINIYTLLDLEVPGELYQPNIAANKQKSSAIRLPRGLINPVIDGKVTDYFEWLEAGSLEGNISGGSMHNSSGLIKKLYYGFSLTSLFIRLDLKKPLHSGKLRNLDLHINFLVPEKIQFFLKIGEKGVIRAIKFCKNKGAWKNGNNLLTAAVHDIVEIKIDLAGLKINGQLDFLVILKKAEFERWPNIGSISLAVPDERYQGVMWQV
ncbi:MAG: glycoside hydrolase [bacterium]